MFREKDSHGRRLTRGGSARIQCETNPQGPACSDAPCWAVCGADRRQDEKTAPTQWVIRGEGLHSLRVPKGRYLPHIAGSGEGSRLRHPRYDGTIEQSAAREASVFCVAVWTAVIPVNPARMLADDVSDLCAEDTEQSGDGSRLDAGPKRGPNDLRPIREDPCRARLFPASRRQRASRRIP